MDTDTMATILHNFWSLQLIVAASCYGITIVHERCCKHVHEKHRAELDAAKDFMIHLVIYSGLILPGHGGF